MKIQQIALFALPVFLFLLFNPFARTQSPEQAESSFDYEAAFFECEPDMAYVNWQVPMGTNASAGFILGAYRFNDGNLNIDLDRSVLRSNDLYYAVNCSIDFAEGRATASGRAALFCNLLTTNGIILVESENLMSLTNAIWYADGTNTVLFFGVPTVKYPDAAVIQVRVSGSDSSEKPGSPQSCPYTDINSNLEGEGACPAVASERRGEPSRSDSAVVVHESLLFLDTAFELWSSAGQSNGATNYAGNSLSNFYDQVNGSSGNSSTNNSGGGSGGNGGGNDGDDRDENSKIIYVDQKSGNDSYSGRSSSAGNPGSPQARPPCANTKSKLEGEPVGSRSGSTAVQKGPKKTIRAGFGIAKPGDTIVIRTGNYGENMNLSGRDICVKIEGNVKL